MMLFGPGVNKAAVAKTTKADKQLMRNHDATFGKMRMRDRAAA